MSLEAKVRFERANHLNFVTRTSWDEFPWMRKTDLAKNDIRVISLPYVSDDLRSRAIERSIALIKANLEIGLLSPSGYVRTIAEWIANES